MDRRQVLRSALGVASVSLSGCLDGLDRSAGGSQSGSGHPCDTPRVIDYQAVDEYREGGVYLRNESPSVQTTCVTVTKAAREREETGSDPPPLSHRGYEVHPKMAVELYTIDDTGTYTITVDLEETTATATVEATGAGVGVTTVEITDASTVEVGTRQSA